MLTAVLTAVILIISGTSKSTAAVPPQQTNLLTNPGFEEYGGNSVANGWTSWYRSGSKQTDCANAYWVEPGWGGASDIKNSGTYAQYVGNSWDTWMGGVYQTVNVTPGSTYQFSFKAYGYAGDGSAASDHGVNLQIRAAVDLSGGNNWGGATAGAIGSPHETWQEFSVQFTATGNKVTLFTIADTAVNGVNQCRAKLNTYYDDAQLIEVAPPATNTPLPQPTSPPAPVATNTPVPPTATATPAIPPTETAVPTPEPSPTPEGGSLCLNAFADSNGNGVHDADEGYMAGITFSVANADGIVGQAVSAGTDQAICFDGLNAGEYQATQLLPARLDMTTAAQAMVTVDAGGTVGIEFGSRVHVEESIATAVADTQPPATAIPAADSTDSDTGKLPIAAYIGLTIIGLLIIGLIALIVKTLKK